MLYPEAWRLRRSKGHASRMKMSKKFMDMGAEVYVEADKVKESNKAL